MSAIAVAPAAEQEGLVYRRLVDEALWERLVGRVMKDEGKEREESERIIGAALGFIKLCADHPGRAFAPSPLVDIGWHTIILYTRHYAALCQRLAGRFIHHEPTDNPSASPRSGGPHATAAFMAALGIQFDPEMWSSDHADCEGPQCIGCFQCEPPE